MRTTLTLDDDIAAALERLRKERRQSLKAVVNETLRRGLGRPRQPRAPRPRVRTRALSLGRCRLDNLDNIAEALAIAEGESFR
jgi:hypothetical protein